MGVYSKPVIVESATNIGSTDYVQLLIDIEETNQSLFEAVIELDFAEAYNKAGLNTLTESDISAIHEAETKSFKEKVKAIIQKVKDWLYNFFGGIFRSIQNLVANDKKIKEKYELSKLDGDRKKKFDASEKEITIIGSDKFEDCVANLSDIADKYGAFLGEVIASGTVSDEKINEIKSIIENHKKSDDIIKMSDLVKKVKIKEMSSDDFNFVVESIDTGYKTYVENYKKGKREAEDIIKKAENIANSIKESNDPEEAKRASNISKVVSEASNAIMRINNILHKVVKQCIAVERSAYLKIGNVVGPVPGKEDTKVEAPENNKEKEAEVVNGESSIELQEAYDFLIEQTSNEYIDYLFA